MPDIKGREELFRIYTRNKPLADDVSPEILAKRTPGFSPADIENLINEAALLTARRNGTKIRMDEIEEATTKVMAGPQKKSRVISEAEKKLTAYHEAGHAIVMRATPGSDPVHQITIIPRGMAGGFTMWLPEEDRFFETRGHMIDNIKHLLGGRVAEELKLDDISTGASNDLERATQIARQMITKYGFSEKLGPVSFSSSDEVFLGRDFSTRQNYSEHVAAEVDSEIRRLLEDCYSETRRILQENDDAFERVAQALLLVETLDGNQFERLFTGEITPEDLKTEVDNENKEIADRNRKEAEESERIEAERLKALEEQRRKELEEQSMNLGIPRGEMDWSEEPEDKFGYEEYRRATERRRAKVQPKKLTEEKHPENAGKDNPAEDAPKDETPAEVNPEAEAPAEKKPAAKKKSAGKTKADENTEATTPPEEKE